jgi:branched-chain amino acid transport system substrate-binding protein
VVSLTSFLVLLLLLTACTSIRPIVKIGLIAPFEGLYRESGYVALDAMRQALAECTPPGIDVLPLALDDSGDPVQAQRATHKLLVDPTVGAVIGPLLFDTIPAVSSVITPTTTIPWFIPPLVTAEGEFGMLTASKGIAAQVDFIAANAPATRVLLLGLPAAWQVEVNASVPTLRVDDLDTALATIEAGDTLLWLGRPDAGARWLAAIHQVNPTVGFWLANQAGSNVFDAHTAQIENRKNIHWLLWRDSDYNSWSKSDGSAIQPSDAMRYSTYRATCAALNGLVKKQPATSARWQLQSQPFEQAGTE